MAKKNETEVVKEEPKTETAVATTRGPSAAMLTLFSQPGTVKLENTERLNMPAMLKPNDFPVDAVLQGEILKIVDSPVTTIKGKLLWLVLSGGREITFPCTGVVRSALAPGVEADDKKALQLALDKHVGKVLTLKRGIDGTSKKYSSDGNPRKTYMFEVFLSNKAK